MNKNIFYLTALLFVFGCSNQSSETETAESAEVESVLLEYMWCDYGPNTSPETLNALRADFNGLQTTRIILLSVHGLIFQHLKLIIMMQFGLMFGQMKIQEMQAGKIG